MYTLTVSDHCRSKPMVYASEDRGKCVKKAFELICMTNDEESQYGWDKEQLEEIRNQLDKTGEYDDDGMVSYVIEEIPLEK